VTVTDAERQLLLNRVGLPQRLQFIVASAQQGSKGWGMTLSGNDADEIRDHCADTLTYIGLDKQDAPTRDGLLLESMIDKFFTG
jgi:hypothetical protein